MNDIDRMRFDSLQDSYDSLKQQLAEAKRENEALRFYEINSLCDEVETWRQKLAEARRENETLRLAFNDRVRVIEMQLKDKEELQDALANLRQQLADFAKQLAEANLAYKNIQNGILIKEANLSYFAEQNKQLKKLLREASGWISCGRGSSEFRNEVKEALK